MNMRANLGYFGISLGLIVADGHANQEEGECGQCGAVGTAIWLINIAQSQTQADNKEDQPIC